MKKIIIIATLLSIGLRTMAQTSNGLAFPSPNNSFLGSVFGTSGSSPVSVDLYTGTALANASICNLGSKQLTIPVSVNYTEGRGIKVQDYATSVGLGWQLNAGGSISRVVRGYPDEQSRGYLGTNLWGQIIKGHLEDGVPWTQSQNKAITGIGGSSWSIPTADGEPDIYYIKTPFFAVQFTFDENGNAVFSNDNGLKVIPIKFFDSYDYSNSSFEVIDGNGNQYYFGLSSQSKETTTANLFGTDYTFPTTWYLDKIVTFNSADSINFSYTNFSLKDIIYHYQSSTSFDYPISAHQNVDSTSVQYTINYPKYIKDISSPMGNVTFDYTMDRRDNVDAARLSNITLKAYNTQTGSASSLLKTFNFHYSYFGDPTVDTNRLRLKLDSITVSGNGSGAIAGITLFSFGYNVSHNLPSRKSLQAVDYWGYNSYTPFQNPNKISIPPNEDYAMANILTDVKGITGADYHFSYELNSYYDTDSAKNVLVGGLRVKKLSQTDPSGGKLYTEYIYNDNNGHSTGGIQSKSYMVYFWSSRCGVYKTVSESPSEYYDLNGNFVGYSSVKALNQNGGYTIFNFSNFSTPGSNDSFNYFPTGPYSIPDVTSSISKAYKRGLLLSTAIYDASGNKVSEHSNTYSSLTLPLQKKAWAYHWANLSFRVHASGYTNSCNFGAPSTYWTYVENYRLTQTIHKDYDQLHPANYVQTTTNYTYSSNKRMVKSIASTDSRGNNHTQTFYYADDSSIPMTTTTEQTALNTMVNGNRTDVLVHKIDNNNGIIHQVHHSYITQPYGYNPKIYLKNTQYYTGSSLVNKTFFNYNVSNSQLLSSYNVNGIPTSVSYGYHSSLPIARVVNATNKITYTNSVVSGSGTIYIPPNYWGDKLTQFTTVASGTITITIPPGSYMGSNGPDGVSCLFGVSLYGPASRYTNLCKSGADNYTCSAPSSVSFTNMPAGTYTLKIMPSTNTATVNVPVNYEYPTYQIDESGQKEFFYESFEEYPYASYGNGHTGKAYWDRTGSYQIYYSPPNNRDYIIQWWGRSNGKWKMNEQPYTGSMALSGAVDDIRIFPSDAQMTSYTYSPLVGKTSEIGPAGHTTTYEYDGLGRQVLTRGDEGNILTKTCYHYTGQPEGCKVFYNHVKSEAFTRNNCSSGYQGTDVTYTVPANTYISTINQEYADAQAQADINANGQAYANSNGSCIVAPSFDVTAYNYTSQSFSLILTNTSTNQQYYFNIQPNQNGQVVGQIPSGVYDAYIGPSVSNSNLYSYQIYTYYQSGVNIGEAYNLHLTCGACPTVYIDNY